jgi:DNA-binding NarL/FixJ family response regulator
MTVRVLVADDSAAFREGFMLLAQSLADLDVVGTAGTGVEAVRQAQRLQPDVVVMDLHMPALGGIEATRRITTTSPHIRVLVLTMLEDDESVLTAMRAGASGYLVKGATQAEITRAVDAVAAGEVIFGPAVARRVLDHLLRPAAPAEPFPALTQREREVLAFVAGGMTNTAIATRLGISQKTVRNHASSIFAKLQVADRGQAIVKAREAGIGE